MSRISVFALTLVSVSLLAATAVADSGDELSEGTIEEIDEGDIERAQEAFNQGASHYYEGEYGRAMVEFRRANELYPHPIFMHNIALSNQQLGRVDRTLQAALEARDMQAEEQLPPPAEATNHALIASIQTVIVATDITDSLGEPEEDEQPVAVDDPPDVDAPSSWGTKGWAGVGAVALGTGGLLSAALIDRNIVSGMEGLEADNWSGTDDEFYEERDSLQSQQSMGKLLLFSGAGLFAVGSGLVVWELMSSPDGAHMALSPSMDRPGMDFTLRW